MSTLRYETDTNPTSAARCQAARNRIAGYMGMTEERHNIIRELRGDDESLESLLLALDATETLAHRRAPVANPLEAAAVRTIRVVA